MKDTDNAPQSYWFVGATYEGTEDQTSRFLNEGIWENGYEDRYLDLVRSMQPGDRIAIKSTYTRKSALPFDNRDNTVSVMAIKATGTIIENLNNGNLVRVNWEKEDHPREWYFSTYRTTICRVEPGDWKTDDLLAFTFDRKSQNINRFCKAPQWRERFGSGRDEKRFLWTQFYDEVVKGLLEYRNDRRPLIEGIHEIARRVTGLSYLQDEFSDETTGPLRDICPFTAMGTFNRDMKDENRKAIAVELAQLLGVQAAIPNSFEGIPVLNNQRSWFFGYAKKRGAGDIDALWRVFAAAARFVGSDQPEDHEEFAQAYDAATKVWGVKWNLSTGLYWAYPWNFPTLDSQSRHYIAKRLGLQISKSDQHGPCKSEEYLKLIDDLTVRFTEENFPVHSFPELSLASYQYRDVPEEDTDSEQDATQPAPAIEPYSVAKVLEDGCFLTRSEIERLIDRLRTKKNLILQGPPGTGKTWIAKRLAFALMGEKDDSKIRAVQFHPNLSYEDFVRGWRPTSDGRLALAEGIFMGAIHDASGSPDSKFVVVIEEINRGNPAQIFGELLTLLEAGKRTPNEALELCYPDANGKKYPIYIPENLYVIGTMNIADRSLALVDLALRRRFAFVTLEPKFGEAWRNWVVKRGGVERELAEDIERRINELNQRIRDALGTQFTIGHSYVTPVHPIEAGTTREWFIQVAETEIGPLLEEYWFDSPKTAKEALEGLLEGW